MVIETSSDQTDWSEEEAPEEPEPLERYELSPLLQGTLPVTSRKTLLFLDLATASVMKAQAIMRMMPMITTAAVINRCGRMVLAVRSVRSEWRRGPG